MAWALIKAGKVVEVFTGTRSVTIDDIQHPVSIFGPKWSDEERAAIGIFPVRGREGQDRRFRKETGNIVLDKDKRPMRETVEIDIDDARDFVRKELNSWANGLVKAAMHPRRRELVPMHITRLILKCGLDRAQWPAGELAKVEADLVAFDYIDKIEVEREKRLADIGELETVKDCQKYDVQEDWPTP